MRLGGAKGVLVRYDNSDDDEDDENSKYVELRPSQIKFESKDNYLEVIRCSTFS